MTFAWAPNFVHSDNAFAKYVVNNWQLSSICTMMSGRPTGSATIHMSDTPATMLYSADALDGFNGNTRVPFVPLDSLYTPWVETENFPLTKIIPLPHEGMHLSLMFEAFNIANNWSPTSLTTQMFNETKSTATSGASTATAGAAEDQRRKWASVGQSAAVGHYRLNDRRTRRPPPPANAPSSAGPPLLQRSRKANDGLTLQTQDLDIQKAEFPGNWGDFGGTL